MLLRQMKYFLSVADCKSFSEAAEQCYISQSAISQQMKILEDELGTELIKRSNRRFQLTNTGEYFYSKSKEIVRETEELKEKIRQMENSQNKQFRIGCRSSYRIRSLCNAMNYYLVEHADVNIDVVYGDHDELMAMLHRGELDAVFNDLRHENEKHDFGSVLIEEEEGLVAVSKRSPLAERERIDVEDLKSIPCIIVVGEKNQDKEKAFFKMLFHTEGNFFFAKDIPSALTQVVNGVGFMPVISNGDAREFVGRFTKLLPLYKGEAPYLVKNYAFYNKEKTKPDTVEVVKSIVELMQNPQ